MYGNCCVWNHLVENDLGKKIFGTSDLIPTVHCAAGSGTSDSLGPNILEPVSQIRF
eukprot:gene21283-8069_t